MHPVNVLSFGWGDAYIKATRGFITRVIRGLPKVSYARGMALARGLCRALSDWCFSPIHVHKCFL